MARDSSPPEAVSRSGRNGSPGLAEKRNSTSSAPRGPRPSQPSPRSLERDFEARVWHRQAAQLAATRRANAGAAARPRGAEPRRRLEGARRAAPSESAARRLIVGLETVEKRDRVRRPRRSRPRIGVGRAAVLALQRLQQVVTQLDCVAPLGRRHRARPGSRAGSARDRQPRPTVPPAAPQAGQARRRVRAASATSASPRAQAVERRRRRLRRRRSTAAGRRRRARRASRRCASVHVRVESYVFARCERCRFDLGDLKAQEVELALPIVARPP